MGSVDGRKLVIGNLRIMTEAGIDTGGLDKIADELRREGATAIFVAIDRKAAGVLAIADPIKATTPAAIVALKAAGIRVVMLTGDNATTAKAVAQKLGITDVEAEVLPEDKSKVVVRFREQGSVVAMAGDGVNDAPALAAADVGIAMGTGTDVAMESAGVTLLKGDLNGIVRARHLSAATMANIRQNLFFAFIYNAAGVPVAAGALYPLFGVLLSPIIAAAAMALSSVSVIANALRLNRVRLDAKSELSRSLTIDAPAERVFAYVDDIRNLARHMSESRSMPMMGSKLKLEILSPEPTGLGAVYRYSGRMMGLTIDFSETVTKYVPGREKVWRTIGKPELLIIAGYEMRVLVEPVSPISSRLTISIDYVLPRAGIWRTLGWALADTYSRWCLTSMLKGTKLDLERRAATP
jgi:soluble P-type ATPase